MGEASVWQPKQSKKTSIPPFYISELFNVTNYLIPTYFEHAICLIEGFILEIKIPKLVLPDSSRYEQLEGSLHKACL